MTEQDKQQRITALKKLFLSHEYLDEAVEFKRLAAHYDRLAVESFKKNGPEDWEKWPIYEGPKIWLERIIPYFEGNYKSLKKNVDLYKQGKDNYLTSCAQASFSYAKMMDGIGSEWWQYVDDDIVKKTAYYTNKAHDYCACIYYTLKDHLTDDEILDEFITGPIDEEQLARYYE